VQIWFQNRRQNSRRKSSPLEGDELRSQISSQGSDVSEPCSSPDVSNQTSGEHVEQATTEAPAKKLEDSTPNQSADANPTEAEVTIAVVETQSTLVASFASAQSPGSTSTEPSHTQTSQFQISSQESVLSTKTGSGYVADRRSASSARPRDAPVPHIRRGTIQIHQPRVLNRSSSYLRISMTDDGQAKVVDRAAPSPSPEKPNPTISTAAARTSGLRRSYSAANLDDTTTMNGSMDGARKLARVSTIGRSRDSRTWEFWCDSDARNSLVERAEQETSGSAAESIRMMRTNSNRALRANAVKLNSPIVAHGGRLGDKTRRPPTMKRSNTHHGRLQSKAAPSEATGKKVKKGKNGEEFQRPNGDSDKENWEPDDAPRGQAVSGVRGSKKVLGENANAMTQSNSLGALMAKERKSGKKDLTAADVDDEVSTFMSGSVSNSRSSSAAVGEELDCVQSLLSLSQGNWA
jgi:hypothetical protein